MQVCNLVLVLHKKLYYFLNLKFIMINNFTLITGFIHNIRINKTHSNQFWFLQLIQRTKEIPGLGRNNNVVKTYYINDELHLDEKQEEIIKLCTFFNARAYIHLTPRNWEVICAQALKHNTDLLINKQFKDVKNSLNSVIGQYSSTPKFWVVDYDSKDIKMFSNLKDNINLCKSGFDNKNVLLTLETKNGYHLITHPFNVLDLHTDFKSLDIHKNNPTILYTP